MENGNYIREEKEINLVGLLAYAMRKWKTLLLPLLIGTVIFAGVQVIRQPDKEDPLMQELALCFRLEELYEAQMAYDDLADYSESSVYLNLDANNVYCGELQYYVSTGKDSAYTAQMLNKGLQDEVVLAQMGTAMGLDCEVRIIRELVTVKKESGGNQSIESGSSGYLVTVEVLGGSEEACGAALDVLHQKAEGISAQLAQDAVRVTSQRVYVYRSDKIESDRSSIDARVKTLYSNVSKLKSSFTADELAYYDAVYLNLEGAQKPDLFSDSIDVSGLIKWAVIGIVLAGFCWVCVVCVKYLMKDWITCADDIKRYGIPLVAHVEKEKNGKKDVFCALADKMEMACDVPYNDLAYIRASIGLMKQETIVILGDECSLQQMDEGLSGLQKVGFAGMVYSGEEALQAAKKADGVILLLEKNRSKHSEIQRELEVCAMHGIKILGAIVIG